MAGLDINAPVLSGANCISSNYNSYVACSFRENVNIINSDDEVAKGVGPIGIFIKCPCDLVSVLSRETK